MLEVWNGYHSIHIYELNLMWCVLAFYNHWMPRYISNKFIIQKFVLCRYHETYEPISTITFSFWRISWELQNKKKIIEIWSLDHEINMYTGCIFVKIHLGCTGCTIIKCTSWILLTHHICFCICLSVVSRSSFSAWQLVFLAYSFQFLFYFQTFFYFVFFYFFSFFIVNIVTSWN